MKKHFKKSISLFLAVIMLLSAVPFAGVAFAADETEKFTEGYYIYRLWGNNPEENSASIIGYDPSISGDIVIPETLGGYPVNEIGLSAFSGCQTITSVTFNKNLEFISHFSFSGCDNLESITIPEGSDVTICDHAFDSCKKLLNINIPSSGVSVGCDAFDKTAWYKAQPDGSIYIGKTYYEYKGEMPENTSITIKEGTNHIAGYAFDRCGGLTNITIPDSIQTMGYGVFRNCTGLTRITFSNEVTRIEMHTFQGCTGLKSIDLPENLYMIEKEAFSGCSSLESIVIPDRTEAIEDYAFENCTGLKSVKIGNGVEDIMERAFMGCTSLTNVEFGDSVYEIKWSAFYGCENLKSVTIPEKTTRIDYLSLGYYWNTEEGKVDKVPDFTIYGYSCTVAEKYANENGFNFVSIGTKHDVTDWKTTIKPTYKSAGEKQGKCSFCGNTVTAAINLSELKDEKTGVSLIYPDGSLYIYGNPTFSVKEINDGTDFNILKNKKGEYKRKIYDLDIQCFGNDRDFLRTPGWAKIPLPEGFDPEKTVVYIVSEYVPFEKVEAVIENGFIYIETDDFSYSFGIVDETTVQKPDPSATCSCNCHKTGIVNFFFKIGLFFQKLFKQNKLCKCGVAHY